jgi:hypothetical protein
MREVRDNGHGERPASGRAGERETEMPRRMMDEGMPEDTEGNMPFRKVDDGEATEDAEGNMPLRRVETGEPRSEDTEDAEGNAVRPRGVTDGSEDDDTEGNAASRKF